MYIFKALLRASKSNGNRLLGRPAYGDDDGGYSRISAPAALSTSNRRWSKLSQLTNRSFTPDYERFDDSWEAFHVFAFHACIYYALAVLGFSLLLDDCSIIEVRSIQARASVLAASWFERLQLVGFSGTRTARSINGVRIGCTELLVSQQWNLRGMRGLCVVRAARGILQGS